MTFYAYVQSVMPGSGTWPPDQARSAGGYATGSDLTSTNLSDYTPTVMNPVTIAQQGKDGRATDQIAASARCWGIGPNSSNSSLGVGSSFHHAAKSQPAIAPAIARAASGGSHGAEDPPPQDSSEACCGGLQRFRRPPRQPIFHLAARQSQE